MADISTINGRNVKDVEARNNKLLKITVGAFSSFPKTISNSNITDAHSVVECVFSDPSAIVSDVTWQTTNGQIVLNGSMRSDASTSAQIILGKTVNVSG